MRVPQGPLRIPLAEERPWNDQAFASHVHIPRGGTATHPGCKHIQERRRRTTETDELLDFLSVLSGNVLFLCSDCGRDRLLHRIIA